MIKKFTLTELLSIFILTLYFSDIGAYSVKYWKFAVIFLALLIILKNEKIFDNQIGWLFLFSVLYSIFLLYNNVLANKYYLINYTLEPVSFYIIGKYLSIKYPYIKIVYYITFLLIIVFSLFPFISNILSIYHHGFMSVRDIDTIWGKKAASATVLSSRFALNISLLPLIFVTTSNLFEKKLKYMSIILFMIGLISYTNTMTRTGLIISLISVFAVLTLIETEVNKKLIFSYCIILFSTIILADLGSISKNISSTNIFKRISAVRGINNSLDNVARLQHWKYAVKGLYDYPLGGEKANLFAPYAHNLWLDVGWRAGILPMIALIIVTTRYISTVWKINKVSSYPRFFRAVILCVSIGFLFSFMVEPVMQGLFDNFCLFCFFFAVYNSLLEIKFT